jgi:4-hydroxy-tetrahydrodipicolinate synthase
LNAKDKSHRGRPSAELPTVSRKEIGGLFTALITPFDAAGSVDPNRLHELVQFQISKGTEGIFPCGTTGLGPMLRLEERKVVAETVVNAAAGKVPVVVQVGSADTASTVQLAKHAERVGADAVASLTPYYYKPSEKAVVKHFEAISATLSIPLFAYNIPQFTGNNLQAGTVAAMAETGTIRGIKDSSRDLLQLIDLIRAVPDDFVVMNGTEEYGLFAIMSGADGLVSGGASAVPEVFKSLVVAQRKGDYEEARAAQKKVQGYKELVKPTPVAAYYEILKSRGLDCGKPRQPFLPLERKDADRVIQGLRRLGVH